MLHEGLRFSQDAGSGLLSASVAHELHDLVRLLQLSAHGLDGGKHAGVDAQRLEGDGRDRRQAGHGHDKPRRPNLHAADTGLHEDLCLHLPVVQRTMQQSQMVAQAFAVRVRVLVQVLFRQAWRKELVAVLLWELGLAQGAFKLALLLEDDASGPRLDESARARRQARVQLGLMVRLHEAG